MKRQWIQKWVVCGILLFCVGTSIIPIISGDYGKEDLLQTNDHSVASSLTTDWWPMFLHDITHSGVSTTNAPDDNSVLWSYQTDYIITSSPAVSHGCVYIGSSDWNLYCFGMDSGALLWNYSTDGQITSSPAVVNGRVYVGSEDYNLYCLDAIDGVLLWKYRTGFIVDSSPTVVDEKVFFGSSDGALYCLATEDGSLLWSYPTNNVILSSPAVKDGKVYFGSTNGDFLCLNSDDGGFVWRFTMTEGTYSSPTVDNGKVYFGSNDQNVYCLDALSGALIWNYSALSEVDSSPAVAYNRVYIGASDGRLLCLDKDTGAFLWSHQISGSVDAAPSVADGKVYFGTFPCCGFLSYFQCLDAFTGSLVWEYNFNTLRGVKSSAALAAGKVFVGTGDGKFYCFGDIEYLADANGPYFGAIQTPLQFTGSVYGGEPGYSWSWDFGDGTTSTEQNPTHTYTSLGEYPVELTVVDDTGAIATDETSVTIEIPNSPPLEPDIYGPGLGKIDVSYSYNMSSTDVNNDAIFYFIDWRDNTTSGWTGPYPSGTVVTLHHSWSAKGEYLILGKAKDTHGTQSIWSEPYEMDIVAPRLSVDLHGGVGLTATFQNIGNAPATNISWVITIDGGVVTPRIKVGAIPLISASEKESIKIFLIGLGSSTISVYAVGDEGVVAEKTIHAFVFLVFVVER